MSNLLLFFLFFSFFAEHITAACFTPQVAKFLKSRGLPREALLLLDNAPSHPDPSILKDGNIQVLFFPPNVTSIGQPMDQGLLELVKMKYRRRLLRYILTDDDSGLIEQLKKVDMLDVVRWILDLWNEVQPITMIRAWQKLLDHRAIDKWWCADDNVQEDGRKETKVVKGIAGCEDFENQDVEEWMKDDNGLALTEDDIVHLIVTKKQKEDMSDDDEEVETPNNCITHSEAFQMFEKVLQYAQAQEMTTASDLILLRKWRDFSARKRLTGARQMKVDDHASNQSTLIIQLLIPSYVHVLTEFIQVSGRKGERRIIRTFSYPNHPVATLVRIIGSLL